MFRRFLKRFTDKDWQQFKDIDDEELMLRIYGTQAATVHLRPNQQGTIYVGKNLSRFISLLHEEVHVNQCSQMLDQGIDYFELSPIQQDLVDRYLEKEACEVEIELGKREGFNDKYLHAVQQTLQTHWRTEEESAYQNNTDVRTLIDRVRLGSDGIKRVLQEISERLEHTDKKG